MLEHIKLYVEKRIHRTIDAEELKNAIDSAANNITANYLLLGQDVTAKEFLDVLINCINVKKNSKESNTDISAVTIIDQAGQPKRIISATIMDYNRNTVFGIGLDGKKLWLGKYNTEQEAENIKNIINTSLIEKKRRCDLRYLDERSGDA